MPVRLLAAIVISCFAFAQTAIAAHEAVYGTKIHFHHGQICALSVHGDRHNHMDVPPTPVIFVAFRPVFVFRPLDMRVPPRTLTVTQRARAPPIA